MPKLTRRLNQNITLLGWLRIRRLYAAAFPRNERKPFSRILSMMRSGKSDIWYFEKDRLFAGFATTIRDEDLILIDYLAVVKNQRAKGVGSAMLAVLKEQSEKALFVEIESMYEAGEDQPERIRRKQFYLRNGFVPMNVMADVFGVKMELLAWKGELDFERYHAFYRDNYSQWAADHIRLAEHPEENRSLTEK